MVEPVSKTRSDIYSKVRNWKDVKEFSQWYAEFGFPILCPPNLEVYITDDAITFPIFRYENFQVELYILNNAYHIPEHSHPYIEVIQSIPDETTGLWSEFTPPLIYPKTHGGTDFESLGVKDERKDRLMLTFEKWPKNVKPSTLAAAWKGYTIGPLHEQVIKKFFPNAYLKNGYVDITKE